MATEGDDVITQNGAGMVDALGGNDTITANVQFNPSPITVDGGSGFDTLNVTTGTVTGNTAGSFYAQTSSNNAGQITYTNIERLVLSGTRITAVFGDEEDWITSIFGTGAASNISTGGGADRVFLNGLQTGAIIDLGDGDDLVDLTGSAPTSNGVFTVQGGQGNDMMLGSSYRDEFYGGIGNDTLDGRGSVAGQQPDLLVGGDGNDVYYAYGRETIVENANEGDDEVRTAFSGFVIPTNVERLVMLGIPGGEQAAYGNAQNNEVQGSESSDLLYTQQGGNDRVFGNGGTDYFYFGGAYTYGGDRVIGGAGYDFLILQGDYSGDPLSNGQGGLDILSSVELQVESIVLLSGFNTSYGGATNTPLHYSIAVRAATLPTGGALEINAAGLAANETLTFYGFANTANERYTVFGGAGNDFIRTSFGNDVIDGGAGADRMEGGLGNDIYFVDNGFDTVSDAGGYDTIYASVSMSLVGTGVEMIASRDTNGTAPLVFVGNNLNNILIGNAGNNALYGGGGSDTMIAGAGNDSMFEGAFMYGGLGDDSYYISGPFQVAAENAGEGFDAIYTSVSYKLFDDSEIELLGTQDANGTANLILSGSSIKNQIAGNAGNNQLYGEGGNDVLYGLAGNDLLDGGTGADYMEGGIGDDTYFVDDAGDFASEVAGQGFDQLYTSASYALSAGSSIELFGTRDANGTAAINLTGNELGQTIVGNAGANILLGGGGQDNLIGGAGDDLLDGGTGYDSYTGGTGADTFRFSDTDNGGGNNPIGWIRDFASEDTIDLSLIDANSNAAGDQAFSFLGTGAFTGTAGQLRYETLGATYRFFGDTNGDGVADFYFDVNGDLPAAADLIL